MNTSQSRINFMGELCKYFMNFLQSGFKSTKYPKRYVRLTNEKNFKIGVDLAKYEKFNEQIRKLILKKSGFDNELKIKKGSYTVKLNNSSIDLLKKLVKKINDKDIVKLVNHITETIKEHALSHRTKPDEAYDKINDLIKKEINEILIKPISEKMDPLIGSQSNFELESLSTLETNLNDLILDPLVEQIPYIFNSLLADKKYKSKEEIAKLFNKEDISANLLNYFSNHDVKDFYHDLQELVNSHKNLDKKEIYLYLGDVEIEKKRFPLFYSQLEIKESSTSSEFKISFSNEIFVNKRAVEYAFQVLFKDEKKVEKFDEERKIFISDQENLAERFNDILKNLISKLRTDKPIDFNDTKKQISKSKYFSISNNNYLCVFDKSDEALINDYEDILSKLLAGDSEVAEMFKQLITDFLLKEPEVINENIEDEWDSLETADRLNYKSPIPLNPEQLKILKALNNEKCKYVVVEGPPGTGKSHTISSIAFEYILKFKSILILSDTREALDVVENKINNTLNQVRGKHNVQNPILRLGKMGNTYNKILAKNSVDNLRTFHRAQKQHSKEVDTEIDDVSGVINDRLRILSDHYNSIDKDKFEEFAEISKKCAKENLVIDVKNFNEFLQQKNLTSEDLSLDTFIDNLHSISDLEFLIDAFIDHQKSKKIKDFILYVNDLRYVKLYLKEFDPKTLTIFYHFGKIDEKNLAFLEKRLGDYHKLTGGLLGGMFKSQQVKDIADDIQNKLKIKKSIDLKKQAAALEIYLTFIRNFIKYSNKKKIDGYKVLETLKSIEDPSDFKDQISLIEKHLTSLEALFSTPDQMKKLSISETNIKSIFKNKISALDEEEVQSIKKYYNLENFFSGIFDNSDNFDYATLMKKLQSLYTTKMTDIIDSKIISFYDNNKNTASSLSKIIRGKQKFPKDQFNKLKNAFPCIISSVRDFSEYIDLDMGMFDLIIIDEASQVSIAQAFPAIIRAKKLLVLGDKKQFSNLQSYQATSLKNNAYLNDLRKTFKQNISKDSIQLERLESFNVKISILDFFIRIANYDTRLKKHFRGYPEHIAYCSKTFYNNDLQAIRFRTKPIRDIIKFEILDDDKISEGLNINDTEAQFIIKKLEEIKKKELDTTVGIITPFTDQQKNLTTLITKHKDKDYFFEKLNLKIMTFDTCQGEERKIVFYSMVANKKIDKLNWIFPVDLGKTDVDDLTDKKAQRLNVGLSRVQEQMFFVLSKHPKDFNGEIGNAIRFIHNIYDTEEKLPKKSELDPNSPMEEKVLNWFKNTPFYLENKKDIELKAQFPIGETFRQLYPDYQHPKFVADFLVIYKSGDESRNAIIEYDGLKDHFDNSELITDTNYEDYYTIEHEERQKALETYGVNFIRLNKFNITNNPIKHLDKKLKETFAKKNRINLSQFKIQESIQKTKDGEKKYCDKCKQLKDLDEFKDKNLRSGIGIVCLNCKGGKSRKFKRRVSTTQSFKETKVKYSWIAGKEYNIKYVNGSGWASERKIKVKSVDLKYVKAYDNQSNENRTFRKDRITSSELV
jgi:superfamily I DNA and/or RNA helicase